MAATNISHEQYLAFDYALYVMLSSYFHKSYCGSSSALKTLHRNYEKIGLDTQYEIEDIIIEKVENEILTRPEFNNIANEDVDITLVLAEDDKLSFQLYKFNDNIYKVRIKLSYYRKILRTEIIVERIPS